MQPMCDLWHFQRCVEMLSTGQALLEILTRLPYPTGHFNEGEYLALQLIVAQQTVHCLNIDVHSFIAELIATTGWYDQRVIIKILTKQGIGNGKCTLARNLSLTCKLLPSWHKIILKTIRQNHIHRFVQQFFALSRCDITHRCEAIDMKSGLLLYGMLALHVQLARHLITIVGKKIVVERLVVAGDTTSDAGSMGSKQGGYFRKILADIKQAQACHPFVTMINDFILAAQIEVIETFHYLCSTIREHGSFVIVAISMQAIHLEVFPQLCIQFILLCIVLCEVNKDSYRITRYWPPANLQDQTFLLRLNLPIGKQGGILLEIRTSLLTPTIRTNKNDMVVHLCLQCLGPCGQHCVYATDLITYLPTRFENIVWEQLALCHITIMCFYSCKGNIKSGNKQI